MVARVFGRGLHMNITGQGSPFVVLEAGIAATSLSWALVAPEVAKFATVVTYDRAGLGWSDPAPHGCTALDSARDLAALLDAAGVPGPIVLAGHSFGGLIARVFQQQYPDRVAGLVLVDPVVRTEWPEMTPRLARGVLLSRRGAMLARAGVVGLGLKLLLKGSRSVPKMLARVSAGNGAGVTERLTGEVRKMPPELWPVIARHWSQAKSFRAMANTLENLPVSVKQLDEAASLGDLPTIVLSAGTADARALAEHEHDANLSSRGEHVTVAGAAHWMQLDAPTVVSEAVRRVVERAAERRPSGEA
jgi:pimeloyl-ACP methyl ester carboxylesterase